MSAKVPQANEDLAQEDLKALSDINAENKDKSGYDANKLNAYDRYQGRNRKGKRSQR